MSKRRRPGVNKKIAEAKFWGDPSTPAEEARPVTPTPEPGALVRSLGPSPLAVDEKEATVHLTAVYSEAVRTATALVAANGLFVEADGGA
ncbi:MAG: hypothetical protein M3Y91_11160 [Actinomycetota bacterium]|nr:hypothetical protein [Actinomycetota bacterium]